VPVADLFVACLTLAAAEKPVNRVIGGVLTNRHAIAGLAQPRKILLGVKARYMVGMCGL